MRYGYNVLNFMLRLEGMTMRGIVSRAVDSSADELAYILVMTYVYFDV